MTVKTLGRNSVYASASEIWRIGSRIILTPIIIGQIGLEGYGVWTLLFSVCAYVSVVHTSFGLAYTKFTAEHDARRAYRELSEILGVGLILVGAVGLIGVFALWAFSSPLLSVLQVPAELLPAAGRALLVVALCVLLRMSIGCVFEVLAGLQRIDLRYKIGILSSAIEFAAALVLLYRGWGLLGLAVGHLCGQVFGTAVAWVLCRRQCPEIRISPFVISRRAVRQLVSLGGRFQLLQLVTLINAQGFKLVMSALLGPAMLGIFEIARKILTLGDAVGGAVTAPLMPAFANVHAGEGTDKKKALFEHSSRVLAVISVIAFGFLAVFADRLIVLWTDQAYPLAAWTVRCFAVAFVAKQLTGVATASLRGEGTVRLEMGYALVASGVWFATIVPAYLLWSYHGMVLSAMASLLLGSVWFLVKFLRHQKTGMVAYLRRTVLQPLLVLVPAIAAVALLSSVLRFDVAFLHGRFAVLFELLVWGAICGLVCSVIAWYAILSRTERTALLGALARGKRSAVPGTAPSR